MSLSDPGPGANATPTRCYSRDSTYHAPEQESSWTRVEAIQIWLTRWQGSRCPALRYLYRTDHGCRLPETPNPDTPSQTLELKVSGLMQDPLTGPDLSFRRGISDLGLGLGVTVSRRCFLCKLQPNHVSHIFLPNRIYTIASWRLP